MKQKHKLTLKTFAMYFAYAAAVFAARDIFGGNVAFGVFVGGLYCANPVVCALVYLASSGLYGAENLIFAGVRVGVMLLFVLIHRLAKKKIGKGLLLLYVTLANVFYCAYNFADFFTLFDRILYSAGGVAFAYVCVYVFRAVFVRGLAYRPAADEMLCIALFAVVMSYCLAGVEVVGLNLLSFVAPFAILFAACSLGDVVGMSCGVIAGFGSLLYTGELAGFAFYVLAAAMAALANRVNRYVAALAVLLTDVLCAYFLNSYGTFDAFWFIPCASAAVIFALVPKNVLTYVRDCYSVSTERFVGRSIVNKQRLNLSRKLFRLSDIFLSMQNTFFSMAAGTVPAEEAEKVIARRASDEVCADCAERNRCWRKEITATEKSFLQLAECAVKRGRCSILDVSPNLSVKCTRLNSLLAEVNSLATAYTTYTRRMEQADSSKLLIGEQMGGVSGILQRLASDCRGKIVFDTDREKEIAERLVFHNILTSGVVLMEQESGLSVIATIAKKDVDNDAVCKIVSGVVRQNMYVERVENTDSDVWINMFLAVKPRFEVTFGVRGVAKLGSEVSGDTHSFVQMDNGKYIFALCDGMGSGESAEKMSDTAISLVENFYRAGFDSDVILSCVNKLLVGSGNDVFCAVDICVVDLYNGLADFIKLGAAEGVVKCGKKTEIVTGSSLPLGVLEEMKPSVTKKALSSGDMVLLASDGFTDCFKDPNLVAQMFGEILFTNPQSVADSLLEKALIACNNKPADDITVVVAKIS